MIQISLCTFEHPILVETHWEIKSILEKLFFLLQPLATLPPHIQRYEGDGERERERERERDGERIAYLIDANICKAKFVSKQQQVRNVHRIENNMLRHDIGL